MQNAAVRERTFPYWWMASTSWDNIRSVALQRFASPDEFDPRALLPDYLVGLMEAMLQTEMHRPLRAKIGAAARR
jgi:hypothetical protein